jgi:hypothetical protein
MPARSCRVRITDREGIAHTVEVTASSLFEAVAMGLKTIQAHQWVTEIPDGFVPVKVKVVDIPVEHEVKLKDFAQWLDRLGNSPKEVMDRHKISEIHGVPTWGWIDVGGSTPVQLYFRRYSRTVLYSISPSCQL